VWAKTQRQFSKYFLCSTEERKSYRFKNANIILAVLKRREENRK